MSINSHCFKTLSDTSSSGTATTTSSCSALVEDSNKTCTSRRVVPSSDAEIKASQDCVVRRSLSAISATSRQSTLSSLSTSTPSRGNAPEWSSSHCRSADRTPIMRLISSGVKGDSCFVSTASPGPSWRTEEVSMPRSKGLRTQGAKQRGTPGISLLGVSCSSFCFCHATSWYSTLQR